VSADKGRWCARLLHEGRLYKAFGYATEREAAIAWDRLVLKYVGMNAARNFPSLPLAPATEEQLRAEVRAARKTNASLKYRGVYFEGPGRRRPWRGLIRVPNVGKVRCGSWKTEREAAIAVDRALLYYLGPSAELNFPALQSRIVPASSEQLSAETTRAYKQTTSSQFRGVTASKGQWVAMIYAQGRHWYLGHFSCEEEAALVYDKHAARLHGAKAKLNFPSDRSRR